MAIKLLNLLAITTIALFGVSLSSTPVAALAHARSGRSAVGHSLLAKKRKRSNSRRCTPRTAPSPEDATTPASASVPASAASAPAATATNGSSGSGSTSGNGNNGATPNNVNAGSVDIGTGQGKGFFAWGLDPAYVPNFCHAGIVGGYTWRADYPPEFISDCQIQGVSQLWGNDPDRISDFQTTVIDNPGYTKYVLGFNEPNLDSQANMSPQDACDTWKQYIQPLKYSQGMTLISPATTSAPDGVTWMQNFMACCDGCTIDAVAVHWYDVSVGSFQQYIELWWNTFNLPIWVTEFACQNYNGGAQCPDDYIPQFLSEVISWMNGLDYVHIYAPFGLIIGLPDGVNPADELVNDDGSVSSLGWTFLNGAAAY